ncbi:TPA: 50S ribosomal protein L29 [Candidatus Geothermarchaeota archaeon]|nr:50S ribosomal protein L29 [Candidatus Geothermarchaeota archaeon]
MKRVQELREKSTEELVDILNELEAELFQIRKTIQSGGQVDKPGRVKHIRKMRARILTILRERGIKI